jgi:hypothetical protein
VTPEAVVGGQPREERLVFLMTVERIHAGEVTGAMRDPDVGPPSSGAGLALAAIMGFSITVCIHPLRETIGLR